MTDLRIAFVDNSTMDSVANKLKTYVEALMAELPVEYQNALFISSAHRGSSGVDFHENTGNAGALDIAAAMDETGKRAMQALARLIIRDADLLYEMIHSTDYNDDHGFEVKFGVVMPEGWYGSATLNAHKNHIHLATDEDWGSQLIVRHPKSTTPTHGTSTPIPVGPIFGVDHTGGIPASVLKAHGVHFVCRYVSVVNSSTTWKIYDAAEAAEMAANDIWMINNFEWYESRCSEGYATGRSDALLARQMGVERGMPLGRPTYLSADEDTNIDTVREYFRGAKDAIGVEQLGVYGSYQICRDLKNEGLVGWTWQTYAWSGGQWDSRNNIEQYSNNQDMGGYSVDYDRALTADYGQWKPGVTPNLGDDEMALDDIVTLPDGQTKFVRDILADVEELRNLLIGAGGAQAGYPTPDSVLAKLLKAAEPKPVAEIDYDKLAKALLKALAG